MSDSLSFNGTDLGQYGLHVAGLKMPTLPEPRAEFEQLGGVDGDAGQGATWNGRRFEVAYTVVEGGGWDANLVTHRAIAAVLAAGQGGEKALVFDNISGRSWLARSVSPFEPGMFAGGSRGTLEFYAPYPWAKATSQSNASNAFTGPGSWVWTPDGERKVAGVWTIKNGATAQSVLALQNTTTSESYVLTSGLAANAWLKLDRANNWIPQLSTDAGSNWSNHRTGILGVIPRIQGGASNTIALSAIVGGSAVTVECDYYGEYWC